jgi:hypothetical protein
MSAFKKSDAPDDNQPDAGTSGPVFVDPSGRRQRWVRRAAMAVTVPLIGYLAFVTVSLVVKPGLLPILVPGAAPAARSLHALSQDEKTLHRTAPAPKPAPQRPAAGDLSSAQASASLDPVANTSDEPTVQPTGTPSQTTLAPPTPSKPPSASPPARRTTAPTPTVDPTTSPSPRCHDWPRQQPDSAASWWQRRHTSPPDQRFRPPRRHCAPGATSP